MKKKTFLFISILFILMSCSDSKENEIDPGGKNPKEPKIEITVPEVVLSERSDGPTSSTKATFTTSAPWTINLSNTRAVPTWFTVTPLNGEAGDAEVTITIAEDNSFYEDRSGYIVIKAGNTTKTIAVSQKKKKAIIASKDRYDISSDGESFSVEVKSNVAYEVIISEDFKEWLKHNKVKTKTAGLTTSTENFEVERGSENGKREGIIVFKSDNLADTIHVFQAMKDVLTLSQEQLNVSYLGSNDLEIEVRTNINYAVTIPDSVKSWIAIAEPTSRAVRVDRFYLKVEQNKSYSSRKAEIIVKDLESNLSTILTIQQAQENAIILSNKKIDMLPEGGTLEAEILSNIEYQVEILGSDTVTWIKQLPTSRALKKEIVKFEVEPTEKDGRETKIVFRTSNGNVSDTLTVMQYHFVDERDVLIKLYEATGGENWYNNTNWGSDKPLNTWYGIETENGKVISIRLVGNSLRGTIPNDINNLLHIKKIEIYNNSRLYGEIPPLTQLKKLEKLGIENCKITKPFLLGLKELDKLTELHLSHMEYDGGFPEEILALKKLEILVLQNWSNLYGKIPPEIGELSLLWGLFLSNNNLEGNIPKELTDITQLRQFEIKGNRLIGEIPQEIQDYWCFGIWAANKHILVQQEGYGLYIKEAEKHPLDGRVYTYQKSSKAKGVNLILVGDGFTKEDVIDGGYYTTILSDITESIFLVEPFKTYREYFTVNFVYAVSEDKGVSSPGIKKNTVFSTIVNAHNSAAIDYNFELVYEYAYKTGITDTDKYAVMLVANTQKYGGSSFGYQAAYTLDEHYRETALHELGHAFGSLLDEYYQNGGTERYPFEQDPNSWKNRNREHHANIDVYQDPTKVLWAHFIGHPQYPYVGIYEGALWPLGVWRPEEISCMADSRPYFNAPSRETIVKQIKKGEGTYSFEEFVKNDRYEPNFKFTKKSAIIPIN